jgi:RNA polymerase sigma factor (TIGR02999 family)
MELPKPDASEITRMLQDWQGGDREAFDRLIPLVYNELHTLASRQLAREWRFNRLQTTAVVSEAYERLFGQREVDWQNRGHFFAIAAQLMRRILVDHARGKKRVKRGAGAQRVSLNEVVPVATDSKVDILAIDQALTRLAEIDERKAKVVELRFFGGLEIDEVADFLELSPITVSRDWKMAKAWLHRALSDES